MYLNNIKTYYDIFCDKHYRDEWMKNTKITESKLHDYCHKRLGIPCKNGLANCPLRNKNKNIFRLYTKVKKWPIVLNDTKLGLNETLPTRTEFQLKALTSTSTAEAVASNNPTTPTSSVSTLVIRTPQSTAISTHNYNAMIASTSSAACEWRKRKRCEVEGFEEPSLTPAKKKVFFYH